MAKFEQFPASDHFGFLLERNFLKISFFMTLKTVIKTVNNHATDIIGYLLKKMVRSIKAISSFSGLIPFETV